MFGSPKGKGMSQMTKKKQEVKVGLDALQDKLTQKYKAPSFDQDMTIDDMRKDIQRVFNFANAAHSGQIRKGTGLPYIVHIAEVLTMLGEWGVVLEPDREEGETDDELKERVKRNFIVQKAAICHDTREECKKVSFEVLVKIIGPDAAELVEELSFFVDRASPLPDHVQKAAYIETFGRKSLSALVIKCADRISNTRNFHAHDATAKYASKYWDKAVPLFNFVKDREDAIGKDFGLSVIARLKYYRDATKRLVL